MKPRIFPSLLVCLFCLANAQGQTIWTQRSDRIGLRLEYLRPNFPSQSTGYEFTNQILTAGGKFPIGKTIFVTIEVPMSWEKQSNPYTSTSKNGLGNFFVGLEIGSVESPVFGEVGARPILRQDLGVSGLGGYFGDFDRGEAYFQEITSYQLALNLASTQRQGFVYRVRIGPTLWVPEAGKKTTTFIDYGAKAGYDDGALSLYIGITGRWNTEVTTGKAALHHLGFDLGYRMSAIRPALFFRLPLDKEISDLMNRTIGANVSVEF